jgi:hypothetical protein
METLTLKLRGRQQNGGEVYRSYFLVTDGGRLAGRGRASVIPMSVGAPMPDPEFVEVRQGGEEEAVSLLIERLLALPGNQGLVAELNDRPS